MKKIFALLFAVVGLVGLQSCEGPEGPPGYDGESVVAQVFDLPATNFYAAAGGNLSEKVVPRQWKQFDGDVILVYMRDGFDNNNNPIWRLMPQTYYVNIVGVTEEIDYNYDFTFNDVKIFAEATRDLASFPRNFTQDQYFRIVVIPGFNPIKINYATDAAKSKDYETIRAQYNLDQVAVQNITWGK
ncbi:hypothetical protein [Flavobacterium sp. JP2137]|uniref:hypothetical protein n=1 Tax=Flavobacterium sp. JP2137 TaxID=3414510 RepID=UPI003D2FB1C0